MQVCVCSTHWPSSYLLHVVEQNCALTCTAVKPPIAISINRATYLMAPRLADSRVAALTYSVGREPALRDSQRKHRSKPLTQLTNMAPDSAFYGNTPWRASRGITIYAGSAIAWRRARLIHGIKPNIFAIRTPVNAIRQRNRPSCWHGDQYRSQPSAGA